MRDGAVLWREGRSYKSVGMEYLGGSSFGDCGG
jgi:hypothetical protein